MTTFTIHRLKPKYDYVSGYIDAATPEEALDASMRRDSYLYSAGDEYLVVPERTNVAINAGVFVLEAPQNPALVARKVS